MPSPRVAHSLFCDDVRVEVGNKFSLMGIYTSDMIFPTKPPVMLPRLIIAVWVISDFDDPIQAIATSVRMFPDGGEIFKTERLPVQSIRGTSEGATKFYAQQLIPISPLLIPGDGKIEITVETERETLRAGKLTIHFEDPGIEGAGAPD